MGRKSGGHVATKMNEDGKKWKFPRRKRIHRFSGKSSTSFGTNEGGESHGEDGGNPAQTPSRCSVALIPAKFCMVLPK